MPTSQYDPQKKSIGELLSLTTPRIVVPDYQRSFSWSVKEVEDLWLDLIAFSERYPTDNINEETYFLGSAVLVNEATKMEVLDGQQRLATATILLSVICEYLARFNHDAATRTRHRYIADTDDATGEITFKLTLNVYDRDFFRATFQDSPPLGVGPSRPSHRLMLDARDFFRQRFEEIHGERPPKHAYQWTLRVQSVVCNHATIIAVVSTDEDNASSVFETLNDRGIGLSTPDLVRSLLLRRANEIDREEIVEAWGEASELDKHGSIDDLLRFYWITRVGDIKSRRLFREVKRRVLDENLSSLNLSRELKIAADHYRAILEARDNDPDVAEALGAARQLAARALYPSLLAMQMRDDTDARGILAKALVTLFARHTLIGGLSNSRLEAFVYELARTIREGRDLRECISEIKAWAPSDDQFQRQFAIARVSRSASTRYVLVQIEESLRRHKELTVAPPNRVHVEHIYPQTPTARWANHDDQINRLGNQTLLARPLNEAIKNANFDAKKNAAYKTSEILMTQELVDCDAWSDNEVAARQQRLADVALGLWAFD